jgi:hypothetical protein
MADDVVIRLQAQSAQLEAALGRLETSLQRLETRSRRTNSAMQTGARRTSRSINEQNKSFTLMVAKLALVTFAVQTLANIFQNTFGAILKNIDDFEVAAIGAAAAITGITSETDRSIGDVFQQNLTAVRARFEELELVAARFFSTGQELQLAFNTLAQRGVVIREDEFNILGKLTDQIKLLTGGQNSQIQIQQELRAILDGNVRTTTAFGKSLQARGVDIQQLSREVRATGSIEVFEQFLTGLDAAGGAIRRTLTSVLTTFQSLVSILGRRIFQTTFDETVSLITDVNNFLIDNRDLIVQIGRFLVSKVTAGWQSIVSIVTRVVELVIQLASNPMVQLLAIVLLVKKAFSPSTGILGFILIMATVLTAITGEMRTFEDVITIVTGSMQILLDMVLTFFDNLVKSVANISTALKLLVSGEFTQLGNFINIRNLQQARDEAEKVVEGFQRLRAAGRELTEDQTKQFLDATQVLADTEDELAEREKSFKESSASSIVDIEVRPGIGDSGEISEFVGDLLANTADSIRDEVIGRGLDLNTQTLGIIDQLKAASEEFAPKPGEGGDTDDVKRPVLFDTAQAKAEAKALESLQRATLKRVDATRDAVNAVELKRIKQLAAERGITGLQAFEKEIALKKQIREQDLEQLSVDKALVEEAATRQRALAEIDFAVTEGDNKITEAEKELRLTKINNDEKIKLLQIEGKIAVLKQQIDGDSVDASTKITEETRKVNRLLEDRAATLARVGGFTNQERAAQFGIESDRARADFAAENLGDTQRITEFNQQQDRTDFLRLVQPQIDAFTNAVESVFDTLIDGIVEGSFEFRDLAQTLSKDLIKSGLQDLIAQAKDAVVDGLESLFDGFSDVAAQQAAQALAVGIGLLLAVLSRIGNEGEFTATGGGGGGSGVQSSAQTRGLIGGDTSLPIAEINNGLKEALIPTNGLLAQIERNTRVLGELGAEGNLDLSALINSRIDQAFEESLLNA